MKSALIRQLGATVENLYGQCPLQGEGTVGTKRFYFRARWNQWTIQVGDDPWKPDFVYAEPWGAEPGVAGYMTEEEGLLVICRGLEHYAVWRESRVQEGQS